MSDKIPAGINTTKGQFDYVFSPATQNALADLLDIDYRQISVEKSLEVTKRSVTGAKVIISTWGALPYTPDLLDCCPDLELILYGAGSFKAYLSRELTASDVKVCTAVHMNALPVAEFTLGLILTSMKNVFRHSREFESDGRSGWKKSRPYSGGYYHTRVGLLGYGRITKFLLDLLTKFDFDVLVADDFVTADELAAYGAQKADVAEVMSTCEVISIHHADVERNWNIINKETLALMKPGVRLINTSRGRMINEADLVEKLREGSITAFLDVTHPEPPADGHPFYELQNCILTPHVAGSVGTEVFRMGDYCLRELTNWIEGKPLENQIDIGDLANRA
jgi:phosphoglycerate dehydrogenase-like enzyme